MNTSRIYSDNLNGFKYDVIMPKKVTNDTKIIVYSTTTDDNWNSYTDLKNEILNNDMDAVIVIPTNGWLPSEDYANGVTNVVDKIKTEYDIKSDGYIGSGFSNPSINAVKAFAKYIDDNPNCDRQILFLNDAVPQTAVKDETGNYHWYDTAITDEEIATFEKNNTFVIDYCRPGAFGNVGNRLLNSDVDILFVCDDNLPSGSWNTQHSYINNKAYSKNGLYSHVMDFVYNDGELPKGYTYYIYDHETKEFIKYTDSSKITTIMKEKFGSLGNKKTASTKIDLTTYGKDKLDYIANIDLNSIAAEGQTSSDLNYAKTLVGSIMDMVKAYANVLDSNSFRANYESTTKIPSQISLLIQKYFQYNVDMIYGLSETLEIIVKVAANYKKLDEELSVQAQSIENAEMPTATIHTLDNNIDKQQSITSTGNTNVFINNDSNTYYKKIANKFLNYDEMYSDDNKLVYAADNDKYKIVVHVDNNKVIEVENYYKYSNSEEALLAFKKLNEKYSQNSDIYKVVYKDNVVKVIYNKNTFENLTVDQIEEKYNSYNKILMPGVE